MTYKTIEIQWPIIEIETCQGKCSQCLTSTKVLIYRKTVKATIEESEIEIGKPIFLCLNCITKKFKNQN